VNTGQSPPISIVILTIGQRPEELEKSIISVKKQIKCSPEIILVWNGTEPSGDIEVSKNIVLEDNIGIPAGRNIGASYAESGVIMFLDDDAEIIQDDLLMKAITHFESNTELGVLGCRLVDQNGDTSRRHVPRIGSKSASTSGYTAGFLGGACLIRKSAWDSSGGYADELFYGMEETDLSWRMVDRGWQIYYDSNLSIYHPKYYPSRHSDSLRLTVRNRVWIAKRNLPLALRIIYICNWMVITIFRNINSSTSLQSILRGLMEGLRSSPLEKQLMHWKTVSKLLKLRRPPII
tara:strand:- start:207 stop:1082 length:876 start_codon:yes stop_codon:yes gene_type:complete